MSQATFAEKFEKRRAELHSTLCIGLDPEWEKLPEVCFASEDPLFAFSQSVIQSTKQYATAWKPNLAFFERFGGAGIVSYEKVHTFFRTFCPEVPIVLDAKRGDLANTAKEYAKYYFETLKTDALTVHTYMGTDSLLPYLDLGGTIFGLCLTSNPGSADFQKQKLASGKTLYEEVSDSLARLEERYPKQVGIVVGGTHPSELKALRERHPQLYFLIPGFGAQGGDLSAILEAAGTKALVNSTRAINMTTVSADFGNVAAEKARETHELMNDFFLKRSK